jgi:hypothetical protein
LNCNRHPANRSRCRQAHSGTSRHCRRNRVKENSTSGYNRALGEGISRDPLEEIGGKNLYNFINNVGINGYDNLGLIGPVATFLFDCWKSMVKKSMVSGVNKWWNDHMAARQLKDHLLNAGVSLDGCGFSFDTKFEFKEVGGPDVLKDCFLSKLLDAIKTKGLDWLKTKVVDQAEKDLVEKALEGGADALEDALSGLSAGEGGFTIFGKCKGDKIHVTLSSYSNIKIQESVIRFEQKMQEFDFGGAEAGYVCPCKCD